ncbi:hypothetical protein AMTRI_Chr10g7170 [Amborella trichopoda]
MSKILQSTTLDIITQKLSFFILNYMLSWEKVMMLMISIYMHFCAFFISKLYIKLSHFLDMQLIYILLSPAKKKKKQPTPKIQWSTYPVDDKKIQLKFWLSSSSPPSLFSLLSCSATRSLIKITYKEAGLYQ